MADKRLAGKVALVTGASRGIGAAIARRLGADGAKVVVNYNRSKGPAEEVVAAIKQAGGEAVAEYADVGQPKEVPGLFAAVKKHYSRLDVLVNNAAIMKRGFVPELSVEDIDLHLGLNVRGYLLCAQEAAKMMAAGGCVINIGSAISRMAYPGSVVYSMTKGAIDVMTRVLAAELGPKGIRVNVVAPGSTVTDMNGPASGKTKDEEKMEIESTALRRQGQPEDIADVVACVASDDCRWVTGAWIDVSGGIRL